ncbi:uncharacterized protein N7482_000794 [Penicillium canariense]|uniref:Non-homologous end-joining factor 1 n=1 Tax=Penicillium canariense TaxID=189055 RepID=A0A9W9LTH3_9EURO|nr:uncharacterized protein N7482_000794 [Penicillium canariense]KAJ5174917.1 hypothetical protein N7482_000794 [Penicillium canariense]
MSSEWRRLNLQQEDSPPLLCQYTWTRQSYELYVTDLTSVWSERLSRKEVLKRADESDTTIDPSEGQEQLDLLLTKIGEALRGDGGTATLNSGSSPDSLEIRTSTKLPAPLRPLKWTLQLSMEGASLMTSRLVLPLLKDEASWESRQRSLLDQLKQKDWVLGKLFDRFEALGVDLGTVFPGAAGLRTARKGSSRSGAAKFIKGAAPFDEQSWLAESKETASITASNLVHEITSSGGNRGLEGLGPPRDKWWSSLPRHSEPSPIEEEKEEEYSKDSASQSRDKAVYSQGDVDLDGETASESDIDEFERQEIAPRQSEQDSLSTVIPPKPKANKKSPSPQPPAADAHEATATESEAESEPASPPRRRTSPRAPPSPETGAPESRPKKPTKKPKGGLGVIGGKMKKAESGTERAPTPSEPSLQPKEAPIQTEDHPPSQATSPRKARKPAKLGMIGGKAKAKAAAPTETSSTQQRPTTPLPERKPRPQSPEAIPESKKPTADQASVKPEPPGSSLPAKTSSSAPAPKEEETEAQKADRRREELKRHLEAKSKEPTKKKRRF